MYSLPTSITIEGQSFAIRDNGDFRMVLDCFHVMNDLELNEQEQVLVMLMIFYDGIDTLEDLETIPNLQKAQEEMFKFFNCGKIDDYQIHKPKLIDWEDDSELICSAINNVAKKEIRAESYLHWWTFIGYYMSVGESALSTVVGIRSKIVRGGKLEKHEREFKRDNPQYFVWNSKTKQDLEDDKLVKELWNSPS